MSENCVSAPVLVGDVCGGVESCRVCLSALRALAGGLVMEKDTDNPGGVTGYGLGVPARLNQSRPVYPLATAIIITVSVAALHSTVGRGRYGASVRVKYTQGWGLY